MTGADWSYQDALLEVTSRLDQPSGMTADPSRHGDPAIALKRMAKLSALPAFPAGDMTVIHVAGSVGKGSTCALLASILNAAGYPTGLYTSPHLHTWRERIALQGQPVTESRFARLAQQIAALIDHVEEDSPDLGRFSAFEMLTAMALLGFRDNGCEVAVIEVGLGGLYDPTNIVDPVVVVLTRIDLEHTAVLGHSLAEITTNKAGIIKPGRPIASAQQESEAAAVITAKAATGKSPLLMGGDDFWTTGEPDHFAVHGPWGQVLDLRLLLPGVQQMENAATAIAALRGFSGLGFQVSDDQIRRGVATATLPGRFEVIEHNGTTFVLDVAHSPAAATSLRNSLMAAGYAAPVWLVAMLSGRQPAPFLTALMRSGEAAVFTQTDSPRSVLASTLQHVAPAGVHSEVSTNLELAIAKATASVAPDQPVAVTGSVELVARVRELLGLAAAAP